MRIHNARRATLALTATFLTVAGLAYAQQRTPYFRFGSNPTTAAPGSSLPSPWTPPVNDRPLEFGKPSVAAYTLRALVGEPVTLTMSISGGTAPYAWQPTDPLPAGLIFANGVVTGTPTEVAKASWNVIVRDAQGKTAQGRVGIDIVEPILSISGIKPFARVGAALGGLVASNVASPSYSMRGMPGATLGAAEANARAAISGTASAAGTFPLTVEVTRPGTSIAATATREVVVENPLEIAFDPPSIPALLEPVAVTISALNVGGTPTLSLTSPSASVLAARGLSYSDGRLTGTLRYGAAANLSLRLRDTADGGETTATLRIPEVINGASSLVIAGEMRQGAQAKAATGSTISATVRTEIPAPRCTVTQAVPGLSVSTGCVISGNATSVGDHMLALTIVPSSNLGATPVAVSAPVKVHPALTLTASTTNSSLAPGEPLDLSVTANGIIGKASFELAGTTPAYLAQLGLSFNALTGAVTGVPVGGTDIGFGIRLRDSHDSDSVVRTVSVRSSHATLVSNVPALSLRSGDVRTFVATTNIPSPTYSLAGAPDYVRIDPRLGVITITAPETDAPLTIPAFDLTVASETREGVSKTVRVANPGVVRPELKLFVAENADGRGNVPFRLPFTTEGIFGSRQIQIVSGTRPPGTDLLANELSGTPTTPGINTITLRLTDTADARSVDRPVRIEIGPSLDIAFSGPVSPPGRGTIDQPFTVTASAQNAIGTVTFENVATASRPALLSQAGLTITPQGVISGTPTAAFNGTINIRMTEVANGVTAILDRPLNLAINAQMTAAASRPQVIYPDYDPAVDIASALMDASGAGGAATSIYVRNGGVLTFTYSEPVTINTLASTYIGNYTVTNVETGASYSVTTSGGSGSFTAGTSATWRVRQNFDAAPETLALGYNHGYVRAPSITTSSAAIPVDDSGSASIAAPVTANVEGAAFWEATGLPPGLHIDPSTGVVSGIPTEYGRFDTKIWLTDGRGVPSWPKTATYNAVSKDTAANTIPIVMFNGADVTKAMLDRDPNGSTIVIPSGDSVEFTYPKPVTANGFYSTGSNGYTLSMTGVDSSISGTIASGSTGSQATATGNMTGGAVARVFRIRNASGYGLTLREIAPTYASAHYNVPYVNSSVAYKFNNVSQPNLSLGSTTHDFAVGYPISLQFAAYEGVAPITLSMADYPPGMTPNGLVLAGTPTTPGVYSMSVSASDSNGVVSEVKRMIMRILPQDTVSTVMPDTLEGTSLPSDSAISALYDRDTWETVVAGRNGASRAIIPVGGSATFTYPKPVQANYLSFTVTGGTGTSYLRVKNGAGEFISNTMTSPAYFNPSSGGTGSTVHIDTTFTVVNTGPNPADLAELRISLSGNTPYVGWVSETFDAKLNGSTSNVALDRRSPVTLTAGLAQSFQNKVSAVAGSDWRITEGTLPQGMAMNSAGLVSGTPTETGTFSIQVAYADTGGRVTMPKPMTFKVLPNASTSTVLPIDIQAPGKTYAEALVALYDSDTYEQNIDGTGPSQVTLANGESVVLTYPEPVRASFLSILGSKGMGTPTVRVSDADTDQVFMGSISASGYLSSNGTNSEWSATRFRITNISGGSRSISMLRLGNNSAPISPSISDSINVLIGGVNVNGSARSTPIHVTQGTSLRITPSSSGTEGTRAWTVASGSWPGGMNLDAGTGVIEGAPTQVGDFTVALRVTDSRGQSSFTKSLSIKVLPAASSSTILPIDIQGTGLSYADALAALYDNDAYETNVNANGPSAFTLASNASVTLTFPEPVRASYLSVSVAAGQSTATFEVANADTGEVLGTVSGNGYLRSNGWNYDQAGTRFRLTNKSGAARVIATLRLGNIGTPGIPTLPETVSLQINGGTLTAPNRRSAIALLTTQASHRITQPSTSGTTGSLTWEITSGRLPEGLDIDYSTGTITGKATEVGSFTINVRIRDSRGLTSVSKPISLTVN